MAKRQPGDFTLVTVSSIPAVRWYAGLAALRPGNIVRGVEPGPACDPEHSLGLLAAIVASWCTRAFRTSPNQLELVLPALLAEHGKLIETVRFDMAGYGWIFDLGQPGTGPAPITTSQPASCMLLSKM